MAIREYASRIYFIVSFLAFAAVIVTSANPPLLRDYPDWVYQAALLARTLSGHPVAGYALKHYPVPNSITTVAIALLTMAFGWLWAAKLWMLFYLGFAAATTFVASRTFAFPRWLWWWLPAALFFGQSFWFATISFGLGSCALLLLICLLQRRRENTAAIAGLIVLCFFLHLIVYAAAALLILLYSIEQGRWKMTWIGLATLPLPLWYFAGRRSTPSNETALGYSPIAHLAVPAAVALLFLAAVLLRPKVDLSRLLQRLLWVTASGLFLAAVVSLLLPEPHLSPRWATALMLVRLKALVPLQLFGFVNVIYQPTTMPLRSATLALLHRPLFAALLALDGVFALASLHAIERLLGQRPGDPEHVGVGSPPRFLWDYITLFSLLYLASPPNALGVISIDMRLAQLALMPALFLLGGLRAPDGDRETPSTLRWMGVPAVVLLSVSLYQFSLSQRLADLPTADTTGIRPQIAAFAAADPTAIADEYDRLRAGKLEGFIFATGLFYQTIPWQHDTRIGR